MLNQIETDEKGYLKNWQDWTVDLVPQLAIKESIELTDAHWEVILFVRDFYLEYKTSPAIRALVKAMEKKFGQEKVIADIYINYSLMVQLNKQLNLQAYLNLLNVFKLREQLNS